MFMKLGLSLESLNKSPADSRVWGSWQQKHLGGERWEFKKKDKHAQRFPFRVHYSGVPGEPELSAGVDARQVGGAGGSH